MPKAVFLNPIFVLHLVLHCSLIWLTVINDVYILCKKIPANNNLHIVIACICYQFINNNNMQRHELVITLW